MRKLLQHSWKLIAIAIIASTASAEIVVLRPGIIQMQVTLTDLDSSSQETVSSIYGWARSVDTGLQAEASAAGSSVKLSVEGDQSYRRYARVYGAWGGNLYMYHDDAALVAMGETVADSYTYDTARVIVDITVIGGTANYVSMSASASEGSERYNVSGGQSVNAVSGQAWIPMIADTSVNVSIWASLRTNDGVSVGRSASQTVDLSGGSVTIPLTFDISDVTPPPPPPPPTGVLQGTIAFPAAFDSLLSYHNVYASGKIKSLSSNGPFEFTELPGSSSYTFAYTYLENPFGSISHPGISVPLPNGGVATRDFIVDAMGIVHNSLMVDGFMYGKPIYRSNLWVSGASGSSTAGYSASDYDASGGAELNLALPAGDWRTDRFSLRYLDTSNASSYLNSTITTYFYNQALWTVNDGDDINMPIPVTTLQTDLIFDVVEPLGVSGEYDIANARLYGYSNRYDELGQLQARVNLDAYGTTQRQQASILRVVGEPGIYQVNASAYVYEPGNPTPTRINFPSFELSMEAGDTPTCDPLFDCPVEVELAGGDVVLTFDQVDEAGLTTVTSSPVGPEPPQNFGVYVPENQTGAPATYYYIQSSATFSGTVEVCFQYDDSGFAGSTSAESDLQIAHYITATNQWEILATTSINTTTNTICAETTSFSPFALVLPLTTNSAPIADAGADQSFTCLLPDEQVLVTLDGSGSSDPDGDVLDYQWSENGTLLATGVSPTTAMSAGTHVVSLEVSDGSATSAPDTVTISLLADEEPPTLSLLGDNPAVLECGQTYIEAGATAFDECSGDLSGDIRIDSNVDSSTTGTYQVRYQVSDDAGLSATAERAVQVRDTAAPDVVVSEPEVMWPPNHTYRTFSLADCASLATDICEPGLDINSAGRILSIYSDEPENGAGDGNTVNDIIIDGSSQFRVRAERQGRGNGRVYGVTFVVEDSAGNTSAPETCYIQVPLCMSSRCQPAQDDGAVYVVDASNW